MKDKKIYILAGDIGGTKTNLGLYVAGNLALTCMATGGIFLGGGIPPKILPALQKSDFLESFAAKGRFSSFVAAIPVNVIRNDKAALMGAAQRAFELADVSSTTH